MAAVELKTVEETLANNAFLRGYSSDLNDPDLANNRSSFMSFTCSRRDTSGNRFKSVTIDKDVNRRSIMSEQQ